MRSQEFKVTIEKTLEGIEYPVYASSPVGSATGVFVLPFSTDQIRKALWNFCEGIPLGRYRRKERGEIQFDELSPQGFGSALFRALFRSEVLALYRESLMAGKPDVAMPVKLNIMVRGLARLPWELLYDPQRNEFLGFGQDTPVIRFVDGEPRPYTFDPPLRVLLVSAHLADIALSDLEHEKQVIEEALDTLKREDKIRIDSLFGATIPELRKKIREHGPHIVHFMGHGPVNHLLSEDKDAESSLGIILRNAPSLRMVVLNAFETARPADSEARLELAHGLARRGVPTIVAMQFQISDEAAYEFVGKLYRVLAEGCGVDEAVVGGRIVVQNRFIEGIEWGTPVLYMPAGEGRIFDDLLREMEKGEVEPCLRDRVEFYYEQGLQYFYRSDWVSALTFLQEAQRLAPGYKDVQRLTETARDELTKQETERRTRAKLAALYRQALVHCDEERWQAAIDLFNEILDIDPHYQDVQVRAEEVERFHEQQLAEEETRLQLEILYQRAQECLVAEDWGRAIGFLEQVVRIDRGYADASDQLAQARWQRQLDELYTGGEEAFAAQDWEQAVANLGAAFAMDPSHRDVETKLEQARQQQRWDALYQEGLEYLEAEYWDEAIEALGEVQPDQRRRKEARVAHLYAEGRQYAAQEKWESALARFEEIVGENPGYRDAAGQLREVRRQKRLHDLYTEGLKQAEAQEWRRAIRAFEQVAREALNYRDVQSQLALARGEAKLAEHYASGKRFFNLGRWSEAIQDFQSIVQVRPGYPNAQEMLKEAMRQQKLADLYAEGMRCLAQGQWQEAIGAFEKLVDIAPGYRDAARQLAEAIQQFQHVMTEDAGYRDVKERLAEARRQQELREQYEQGMACFRRGDWKGAISALGVVVKKDPNYEDAFVKLSEARRQQELASHYAEGERYMTDERWDEAIAAFEKVAYIDSQYRDVKERLKEANGQKRLAELYAAGQENLAGERWEQAIEYFRQVLGIDETYKDISEKLRRAEREYRLEDLYRRGLRFYEAEKWSEALELWSELATLEPNYPDIAVRVKKAKQQKTLEDTYAVGVASLTTGAWEQAITAFEKIIGMDADYRDARYLLREAEQRRWAKWKSRMLSSLQDSGKLTANSLDYVPERLRSDIMRKFYEEQLKNNLDLVPFADFQVLTLSDFDLVSALRETWRAMMASQSGQIELLGPESAKSFNILADELTDQLCRVLDFVRVSHQDRQHRQLYARMIRTPTLYYRLPPRSPLVIFAKRSVEAADVRDLLDLMRILERPIGFALLVTLGDAEQLKTLLDQEIFEHDFVVLSQRDLERILLSRNKVGQLTQTILDQVSLTVISPYRVAGPVPENMFFGREKEIGTIRDTIRDTNFTLTGGRRIGKTSTLQKVQGILTAEPDCKTFHLDCHAIDTSEIFKRELTKKLSGQFEPSKTFRQAIEMVKIVEGRLIVILLDEVDDLLQHNVEQQGERLFRELRSLSQEGYCNFIFCGGKTLYERIHKPDSTFFNFCHNVELHFLKEESAARIITQPMSAMGIELKDRGELVAQILEVSSCHPNIVQLICKKLVENIKERTISLDDLNAVITSEDFYTAFKEIAWGQATSLERIVSLAFVEDEGFTASEMYQRLAEFGIEDREAIDDALDTLELYSLITRLGKRYEYAFREFPRIVRETEDTEILIESFARQLNKEV